MRHLTPLPKKSGIQSAPITAFCIPITTAVQKNNTAITLNMLLFVVGLSTSAINELNNDKGATFSSPEQSVLSDQPLLDSTDTTTNFVQLVWDTMATLVSSTKSSTLTLLCTLLSLLLCLGLANTFFQSAEAFRSGLHRRVLKPVMSPFQRILSKEPQPQENPVSTTSSTESTITTSTSEDDDTAVSATTTKKPSAFADLMSTSFDLGFLKDLEPPFSCQVNLTSHLESPDVTHFCFLLHGHRGLSKDLTYMQIRMQQVAAAEKSKKLGGQSDGEESQSTPPSPTCSIRQDTAAASQEESAAAAASSDGSPVHDMVVHNSVCNEGKTTDGIRNAGDRLVNEMRQVIEDEMTKRHPELEAYLKALLASEKQQEEEDEKEPLSSPSSVESTTSTSQKEEVPKVYDITISILGNSLGGLYGRYAIAKLIERHCVLEPRTDCWILDGRFRLHLNIFCTTATPHLGVSRHTYVKLPRTAEIGVAHTMGTTGKDLFRLNDLLYSMATSPAYLQPLSKFRKRVAYANAYGTDFAVPASTAAFLSENSTYPHYIVETNTTKTSTRLLADGTTTTIVQDENDVASHGGLVIATLYTPAQPDGNVEEDDDDDEGEFLNGDIEENSNASSTSLNSHKSGDQEDELDQMSRSLDRLGWKKVFVDIRRELPGADFPKSFWKFGQQSSDASDESDTNTEEAAATASSSSSSSSRNPIPNLQSLQLQNRVVESREVAAAVASPMDNRVALPLGHNMIVAFSRSRLLTFLNKGGRPIVDALAQELVEEIFTWDQEAQRASQISSERQTDKVQQ